jgi:hypothetical protein
VTATATKAMDDTAETSWLWSLIVSSVSTPQRIGAQRVTALSDRGDEPETRTAPPATVGRGRSSRRSAATTPAHPPSTTAPDR